MSDDFQAPPPPPPANPPAPPVPTGQVPGQASGYVPFGGPRPPFGYAQAPFGQPVYAQPYAPTPWAGAALRAPRPAWFWPLIILGSVAILGLLFWGLVYTAIHSDDGDSSNSFGSAKIAVIDLDGVILDSDKIDAQLKKYGDDSSVKAIILRIDSPGGGAAASQEIFHEVVRVRKENKKKIVASIQSVGASGAYYIASGCDKIYANDASVVGSIGVIMEWTNYGDLMKWAKLKPVVIHAGELKDAGDPSRDMTPKEAAYFQSLVDNMYSQFVGDVATGRHTTYDKIQPLATGQVWTGQQSIPLGLIDKIGGYRVALMDTARDVDIKGEPSVVRPAAQKKGLAAILNGDADNLFPNPTKLLDRSPGFFFLWK